MEDCAVASRGWPDMEDYSTERVWLVRRRMVNDQNALQSEQWRKPLWLNFDFFFRISPRTSNCPSTRPISISSSSSAADPSPAMTTLVPDPPSLPPPDAVYSPLLLALPSPVKKPRPLPWAPQETLVLIQAYQEKWYSLQRRPLRASQWEEVSITVAARCGLDEPLRTALQCRHKLEKLRKRYRIEKTRRRPGSARPIWEFFDAMERLEVGPLPISARPMAGTELLDSGEDDEDDVIPDENCSMPTSFNHVFSKPSNGKTTVSENGRLSKFRVSDEENGDAEEGVWRLAEEIRGLAGRLWRMENDKMEMIKETERYRKEMENRKTEMILESHRRMVDTISRALGSSHKKSRKMTSPL